ncbi:MAG: hypothetical protein ACUVSW_06445 [Roseiflexus sp.]
MTEIHFGMLAAIQFGTGQPGVAGQPTSISVNCQGGAGRHRSTSLPT